MADHDPEGCCDRHCPLCADDPPVDPTPKVLRHRRVLAWFRGRTGDTRARTEDV